MRKLLSICLAVVLVVSAMSVGITASAATVTSGTTGECTWTLDGTHLTISGNGRMEDYSSNGAFGITPWGKGITSVDIKPGVTSIGDDAFYGCTRLTSVTIPDSVTSISYRAFDVCAIKELIIAEGSKTVTSTMVICINTLEKVIIPNSVTRIDDWAFYGCKNLTSITIPDSVTSIGDVAFEDCKNLTSITIPDSVASIGGGAFSDCTSLTSISIPDSVTSIDSYVFYGCTGLTSITIPDSITSIGECAFEGCTGLTSITIPNSVRSIGRSAFSACKGLTAIIVDEDNKNYCSVDGVLYNKDKSKLVRYPAGKTGEYTILDSVAEIGYGAFRYCTGITSITIPDSVTSIGDVAFEDCTKLTSVTIGNSVTSTGGYAFSGCAGLTSITIPGSVTSIGDGTFSGCTGLTSITIPNSVTSIGIGVFFDTAYYNNDNNWTDGVLYIGNHLIEAKKDAVNDNYTIRQGTKCIAGYAFFGCTGLTSITIPDSVTSIDHGTFIDCTGLTSINIPEGVTNIGETLFLDCTSLISITIPDSVTSIGDCAFYDTAYYNDDNNWTDGVLYIGNHLIDAKSDIIKGDFIIRQGTRFIAWFAFYECTDLTSVTIPDGVTGIGSYTFSGCTGLTSITIPNSVTSIGEWAFGGCTGLTSIIIPDSVTEISWGAFDGCSNLVIKTPENSTAHKYALENDIDFELIEPVTVESNDKNITISTDSSVIPSAGVSLSTEKVENIGEKYEAQLKNLGAGKFTAYNIDLMKDDAKIQPNGKVAVSIAVPDGMDGAKCKVYRTEADGTLTDMRASLNDGKLTFTTDHFSLYIIAEISAVPGDVNEDGIINANDAIAILRYNAKVETLTDAQLTAANVDGNESVDSNDAILILKYDAKAIDKFPVEK